MPRKPETMHRCSSSARSAYEQLWLAGSTVYGRLHTFFRAVRARRPWGLVFGIIHPFGGEGWSTDND